MNEEMCYSCNKQVIGNEWGNVLLLLQTRWYVMNEEMCYSCNKQVIGNEWGNVLLLLQTRW